MKKYFINNWKTILAFGLLFFWGVLIYHPSSKLKFLLIDDGQIVKNSREIIQNLNSGKFSEIGKIIMEPDNGRVRPAYWLVQALVNTISFSSPMLMHAIRLLILLVTCFLINKILSKFNVDLLWRSLTNLLFITNFQNFENYYRLGPTEIFLGLYYLIFIYVIFDKSFSFGKYLFTLAILIVGAFTKESFFLLSLPLLVVAPFIRHKDFKTLRKNILVLSVPLIIFGAIVIFIKQSYGQIAGYSANYKFGIAEMISRFNQYLIQINFSQFPLLIILTLYICYWLFKRKFNLFKFKEQSDVFTTMLIGQVIIQTAVLLPWVFVLGRYLILVNISLALLYGIALNELWIALDKYLKSKHKYAETTTHTLKYLSVVVLMPVFMIRNIFPDANFQLWQKTDNFLTQSLLTGISQKIPTGITVYNNYKKGDDNIEIFLEAGWHLEQFFGRPDIKFVYLDETNLCVKQDRYIFDRTSVRFLDAKVFKQDMFEMIASGSATYSPINYGEVKKSFIQGGRSEYWDQNYKFDWAIYKQKKNTCIKVN